MRLLTFNTFAIVICFITGQMHPMISSNKNHHLFILAKKRAARLLSIQRKKEKSKQRYEELIIRDKTTIFLNEMFEKSIESLGMTFENLDPLVKTNIEKSCGNGKIFINFIQLPKETRHDIIDSFLDGDKLSADIFYKSMTLNQALKQYKEGYNRCLYHPIYILPFNENHKVLPGTCFRFDKQKHMLLAKIIKRIYKQKVVVLSITQKELLQSIDRDIQEMILQNYDFRSEPNLFDTMQYYSLASMHHILRQDQQFYSNISLATFIALCTDYCIIDKYLSPIFKIAQKGKILEPNAIKNLLIGSEIFGIFCWNMTKSRQFKQQINSFIAQRPPIRFIE